MATAHDGEDLKIEKETLSVPMREKRKPAKNSTKNRITKKLSLHRRIISGEINPKKIEINIGVFLLIYHGLHYLKSSNFFFNR